jgi:kynureninase
MTQRDEGHDFRDSKNKAEAYERKKKKKREQAQRLVDKWDEWQYDAYENNKSDWTNQDDKDCQLISKILSENKAKFD